MRRASLYIFSLIVVTSLALSGVACEQKPKAKPARKQTTSAAVQPKQQTKSAVEPSKSKSQEKQQKDNKGVIYKKKR